MSTKKTQRVWGGISVWISKLGVGVGRIAMLLKYLPVVILYYPVVILGDGDLLLNTHLLHQVTVHHIFALCSPLVVQSHDMIENLEVLFELLHDCVCSLATHPQ